MIEAPIQKLSPRPSLSFSELWVLTLGTILQKACSQGSAEAHSAASQEQLGLRKVANSGTALEVARPLSVETWDLLGIFKTVQEQQENSSRLKLSCIPPRLIFESFLLLAFKLIAAHQQPSIQSHSCQYETQIKDKNRALIKKHLVSHGTQLVTTYSFRRIQMLLSENCHLDPTKEANTRWTILEKQMQRYLMGTTFRTMKKSHRAKALFKRISKKRILRQFPWLLLTLTNSHQFVA